MILVAVALGVAVIDWWAVAQGQTRVEYVAKPMVMVALMGAVVVSDGTDPTTAALIAIAFGFSLLGDVALMVPDGPFEAGLAAFLVAHGFTIAALIDAGFDTGWLLGGIVIVGVAAGKVAGPIIQGAARRARALGVAVAGYVAVLASMALMAVGVGHWATVAGGLLFLGSDALLGWGRFVGPAPGGRVAVHVTYHLAQAGFATWVVTG